MRILVVNGPNLNLLGTRSPEIYGEASLAELEALCRQWGLELGATVESYQSNHEGELIDRIHDAMGRYDGVVANPGALAHYSYALRDAIEASEIPTVEVHISDIKNREKWRRQSVVTEVCIHAVIGEGIRGYRQAIEMLTTPDAALSG